MVLSRDESTSPICLLVGSSVTIGSLLSTIRRSATTSAAKTRQIFKILGVHLSRDQVTPQLREVLLTRDETTPGLFYYVKNAPL